MADIADANAVKAMFDGIGAKLGPVDILVLNASVRAEIPFTEMSFEQWRRVMNISLDGAFHCVKACLPGMIERKRGNIVTLGGDGLRCGRAEVLAAVERVVPAFA